MSQIDIDTIYRITVDGKQLDVPRVDAPMLVKGLQTLIDEPVIDGYDSGDLECAWGSLTDNPCPVDNDIPHSHTDMLGIADAKSGEGFRPASWLGAGIILRFGDVTVCGTGENPK